MSTDTAIMRISSRNDSNEIFEKKSFLQKVRENYLSISDERFNIVDGSGTIEDVFKIIREDIIKLFKMDAK